MWRRRAHHRAVLIFHHQPKTGGTSLRYALQRLYGGGAYAETYDGEAPSAEWARGWLDALPRERRERLRCVAGHSAQWLAPIAGEPVRLFTLIREPVDRAVSYYHYVVGRWDETQSMDFPSGRRLRELGWTLADIYRNAERAATDPLFHHFFNGQVRYIVEPYTHAQLAAGPITRSDVPDAAAVLDHLLATRYTLGVQERHAESIAAFAREFGWDGITVGRDNVTASRPAVGELSSEDVALILAHNRLDAELHARALQQIAGVQESAPAPAPA
jgi:hypothetical protein